MKHVNRIFALLGLMFVSLVSVAAPQDDLLSRYAAEAKKADSGFTGFSASQGEKFHKTRFGTGKPDTPACASCHAESPRQKGETRTGKVIEPMAVSVSPRRYTDSAKVEKWFQRNCNEVLGRACTPREKGDWLSYVLSQ